MKRQTLLLLVMTSFIIAANAQKKQKQNDPGTGYVITATEKGGRSWKEVKLVNVTTGEEIKSVYQSTQEIEALNARTLKPVVKKSISPNSFSGTYAIVEPKIRKKVVNLDEELNKVQNSNTNTNVNVNVIVHNNVNTTIRRKIAAVGQPIQTDKPFATNSAAMAYDKKHNRLYYTPMNIAQLRYIDLKTGKIFYFEDEPFGTVKGFGDVSNQITRMVIASDGNGYALSNDGNHLIRFTTGKNPTITDLGALADDGKNEKYSIHSPNVFGGDMIADANENLYLITANRNVFKFSIDSKVAAHLGTIKGLPRGFSTNGAMVESGSKVIVASSQSTEGYYRFDLNTMQAEKVSAEGSVFNASDLANGNLAFDKKRKNKKDEEQPPVEQIENPAVDIASKKVPRDITGSGSISFFPNPATSGYVKVSFNDQPAGKYQVQLMDISGKLISSREVMVNSSSQIANFDLPEVAKGNYLLKVVSEPNKVSVTNKIVVQ
ncbi:MAG TPA: T9SS type A sorting domain-containing protein [Chitinophagaceae bacterium]|nr:T9SS type A sorting domain-containing protein [Chitinophagaceae bacterium]